MVLSIDARGTVNETGKTGKESRNRHEISGNPTRVETFAPMLLTIDSGCAACALPVGVVSTVGMQELNRTPQEHIAPNAEKIRELGFKDSTFKFQNVTCRI